MSSVLSYVDLCALRSSSVGTKHPALSKDPTIRPSEGQNQSGPPLSLLFNTLRGRSRNVVCLSFLLVLTGSPSPSAFSGRHFVSLIGPATLPACSPPTRCAWNVAVQGLGRGNVVLMVDEQVMCRFKTIEEHAADVVRRMNVYRKTYPYNGSTCNGIRKNKLLCVLISRNKGTPKRFWRAKTIVNLSELL